MSKLSETVADISISGGRFLRQSGADESIAAFPGHYSWTPRFENELRSADRRPMKVALVHDFLVQMGGAERVLEVLHSMFPNAPVYTSAYSPDAMPASYKKWDIRTSFLQNLPMKSVIHRGALMLYPLAFEAFDFTGYDLVISSSSAFAKGIITQPHTYHICYTHTPMRYAWMSGVYLQNERVSRPLRGLLLPGLHYLRMWDQNASSRVDRYVANSRTVADRIRKFYRRNSDVIHPPVDTHRFHIAPDTEDYYIIVSRFAPYKRLDLAVESFTKLNRKLKIVGTGRQMDALKSKAGSNVEFLGWVPDKMLPDMVARARAYIMPGEEDFGMAPVEANASGRPVIAFAGGGALDTQIHGVTGMLFTEQTVDSLCDTVLASDKIAFDPQTIRTHAQQFSGMVFRQKMSQVIQDACCHEDLPAVAVTAG